MEVLGYIFLVIIIIVVINFFKSPHPTANVNNPISNNLVGKYSHLIKSISDIEQGYTLFKDSTNSATLSRYFTGGYTKFYFEEGLGIIYISWESDSLHGKQFLNWEFSSNGNQSEMFNSILYDLKKVASKLLEQQESNIILKSKGALIDRAEDLRMQVPIAPQTTNLKDFENVLVLINRFFLNEVSSLYNNINSLEVLDRAAHEVNNRLDSALTIAFSNTNPSSKISINQFEIYKEIKTNLLRIKDNRYKEIFG